MSDSSSSDTQLEHVKSITTLRSGKIIDKIIPVKAPKPKDISKSKSSDDVDKSKPSEEMRCPIPAPFPQRLQPPSKIKSKC